MHHTSQLIHEGKGQMCLHALRGHGWQITDLNRGTFGFVQLAEDMTTGEYVAIKFIERGDKITKVGLKHMRMMLDQLL